ncbi:MAG: hypothetical protein ACOYOB_16510 [Myxococcota bacterium]
MKSFARLAWNRIAPSLAAVVALLLPVVAFASEGGGGEGTCKPSEFCFPIQGYYIIDFIAFVAILVWAGRKPIAKMLNDRHDEVTREIDAARVLQEAARARYEEYRSRVEHLEEELARTMAEVRQGTELEVQRILADAEHQVQRITAEEQTRMDQEAKRLRQELERDAARLALQLAETMLRQRLDVTGQQKLVERALVDLQGLAAQGSDAAVAVEKA